MYKSRLQSRSKPIFQLRQRTCAAKNQVLHETFKSRNTQRNTDLLSELKLGEQIKGSRSKLSRYFGSTSTRGKHTVNTLETHRPGSIFSEEQRQRSKIEKDFKITSKKISNSRDKKSRQREVREKRYRHSKHRCRSKIINKIIDPIYIEPRKIRVTPSDTYLMLILLLWITLK